MPVDFKVLGFGEQLVDGVLSLPRVLLQSHARELGSQGLDPGFQVGELETRRALQLVEHGADLEDLVAQAHLLEVAVHD